MTDANASSWENRLRNAEVPELRQMLELRLRDPHREGPPLDDRSSEGAEEILVRSAAEDPRFQARLEQALLTYLTDEASSPAYDESRPILRGIFEIAQRRPLPGVFTVLQAWLDKHRKALEPEPSAALARAALGALATSQLQGIAANRDFWLQLWKDAPDTWKPRIFMGLRLADPAAACEQIPSLLEQAGRHQPPRDPSALLRGLWGQPAGKPALMSWLQRFGGFPAAATVRRALPEIPETPDFRPPRPVRPTRPALRPLGCGGRPWAVAA